MDCTNSGKQTQFHKKFNMLNLHFHLHIWQQLTVKHVIQTGTLPFYQNVHHALHSSKGELVNQTCTRTVIHLYSDYHGNGLRDLVNSLSEISHVL